MVNRTKYLSPFVEKLEKDEGFKDLIMKDVRYRVIADEVLKNPNITMKELFERTSRKLGIKSLGTLTNMLKKALTMSGDVDLSKYSSTPYIESEGKARVGGRLSTSETLRMLDESYANALRPIKEGVGWFMDAITSIGFNAMLIALQFMKIPPKDFMKKIESFKDPKEFVKEVTNTLVALAKAGVNNFAVIKNLSEEIELKDSRIKSLEAELQQSRKIINQLIYEREDYKTMLMIAILSMDEDYARKFSRNLAIISSLRAIEAGNLGQVGT